MAARMRFSRYYQRLLLRCGLAIVLVTAIICFSNWPPAVSAEPAPEQQVAPRSLQTPAETFVKEEHVISTVNTQEPVIEVDRTHKEKNSAGNTFETRWRKALPRIETMFSDELRIQGLLAPITETGERLLRDLSHRTRAFREAFEIWEDLHLDRTKGRSFCTDSHPDAGECLI